MHPGTGLVPQRRQPLDWILDRALGMPTERGPRMVPRPSESRPRHPSSRNLRFHSETGHVPEPHEPALVRELMKLCGPRSEHARILEITNGEPFLAEPLGHLGSNGYTAVMTGSFDARALAGRFPGFTFRFGAAEDCLAVGEEFDRVVASLPVFGHVASPRIAAWTRHLHRHGLFIARAAADSDWTSCTAAHRRLGLRIVDRIPVDGVENVVVSRRR